MSRMWDNGCEDMLRVILASELDNLPSDDFLFVSAMRDQRDHFARMGHGWSLNDDQAKQLRRIWNAVRPPEHEPFTE